MPGTQISWRMLFSRSAVKSRHKRLTWRDLRLGMPPKCRFCNARTSGYSSCSSSERPSLASGPWPKTWVRSLLRNFGRRLPDNGVE
jgi:hypothetical protein